MPAAFPASRDPWALLAGIVLLAFLFAKLEIQIEGPHGWAAGLPTWRLPKTSPWRRLFGGREVTGYHVYAFAFMAAVFHLPLLYLQTPGLRIEARILASLGLFWTLEDFLWFALNPAFGLRRFRREHVPWHPHWFCGIPVDYLAMLAAGALLYAFSCGWPGGGSA